MNFLVRLDQIKIYPEEQRTEHQHISKQYALGVLKKRDWLPQGNTLWGRNYRGVGRRKGWTMGSMLITKLTETRLTTTTLEHQNQDHPFWPSIFPSKHFKFCNLKCLKSHRYKKQNKKSYLKAKPTKKSRWWLIRKIFLNLLTNMHIIEVVITDLVINKYCQ